MTVLLEVRERLKLIYSKYEAVLLPVAKFLLAFLVFNTLNSRTGYMTQLNDTTIVLIVALTCSVLPAGVMVAFAAAFSLAHMYALSMEVALVGLCAYLVLYLLFFRFSPRDSLVVLLTPLLCAYKIPYVVPIVVGLLCGPSSIVSVGSGVFVHYLIELVTDSASNIKLMGEEDVLAKVRLIIEGITGNKSMLVVIAAFGVTVFVVYMLRRLPVNYSWTIAMITGAMVDVVILLIGDLLYEINISVSGALLGSLLAVAVAKVIEFFRFCVDYSRTEKVQFEDDEYYYYVKAVPKMTVPVSTKTVKRINSPQAREAAGTKGASRPTARGDGSGRGSARTSSRPQGRSGRSVVVKNSMSEGTGNGYEEWS